MEPQQQGAPHWWEYASGLIGFGTAVIAFFRGMSAARRHAPASDDLQDRVARLERRCERMEGAVIEMLEDHQTLRRRLAVPPLAETETG